jgi:formylglycine-generating enzyme required for sulfatase activity
MAKSITTLFLILALTSFGCTANSVKSEQTAAAVPDNNAPAASAPALSESFEPVESEGRDEATGLWKEIAHKKTGMRLRLIPAGEFDMGSPDREQYRFVDEGPLHRVTISKPFYMGKFEVTQAQWKALMGNNPGNWQGDNLPVEEVSWLDAQEFLRKAGEGFRLPTEAEWEYACRAGSKARWGFGDDQAKLVDYAWYIENSDTKTHEVGTKKPNAFGLYDMHGNVYEWCSDWYGEKYYEECKSGVTDPAGPANGEARVCRGASWAHCFISARCADREKFKPEVKNNYIGLRVVVPPPTAP